MNQDQKAQSSRRGILRAGLAVIAAGGMAGSAMAAGGVGETASGARRIAQADKLAQAIVQYQTTPKDGAQCSTCVNFEAPAACKIVASPIAPTGWCVAYAPKTG